MKVKLSISQLLTNPLVINTDKVWVKFRRNTLKLEQKSLIEDGCRLTDKHIGFASSLISHQFPRIGGLRTTLLQTRYYCFPSENIQAISCRCREHWIVASNMFTNDCSTVNVYDSLFAALDEESNDLISIAVTKRLSPLWCNIFKGRRVVVYLPLQ